MYDLRNNVCKEIGDTQRKNRAFKKKETKCI